VHKEYEKLQVQQPVEAGMEDDSIYCITKRVDVRIINKLEVRTSTHEDGMDEQ
jgi:hypothetical protein